MRKCVAGLSLLLALFTTPHLADADPLTLNALSIVSLDIEGHAFRFAGSSFDLRGGNLEVGFFIPFTAEGNFCFPPCQPGDVVAGTLRTDGEVDLSSGTGVIDGVEFPSLTFRGSLAFTIGPFVLPDTPQFVQLAIPFLFDGALRAFDGGNEVFGHALRGRGTLFENFGRNEDNSISPVEDPINFVFESPAATTPEPSTMLLVGGGALAVVRGRWRRTRLST